MVVVALLSVDLVESVVLVSVVLVVECTLPQSADVTLLTFDHTLLTTQR